MAEALALAARARPTPNPPVGAIVARSGRVVGRGFHRAAGLPHAEVEALREAGKRARGADLYVTLEPCNHHGRTPPCTEAILAAGIRRVVFGARDPNSHVRGGGAARLRRAGLEVLGGVLGAECAERITAFEKSTRSALPFVTLKIAASLDGRIAARTGRSKWITGPASRAEVQRMRAAHDAVLVGAGTVRADDPRLTLRLPRGEFVSPPPVRIVLAGGHHRLPAGAKVFRGRGETWVVRPAGALPKGPALPRSVRLIELPAGRDGRIPERVLLRELGRLGIMSMLVEGGGEVFTRLMFSTQFDRLAIFLAPRLLGGPAERVFYNTFGVLEPALGLELELLRLERYGGDVLWVGKPCSQG
ncbi:MAG: bifunctional diaminohydroxyphosphoribosylaminopyrimidine deaminase/5-amino-6-(5-phosphoribosylamino)uracil reductase RibD [Deltaproteobacteria bacterium]|nr:bifunctional diaminohydroxyphosphoribosylaminopyrimidine deaminase/5-amino-6-(5-phosphoribosylamino)uracil reductase RibD [Deltaproteobacteria bacterium]